MCKLTYNLLTYFLNKYIHSKSFLFLFEKMTYDFMIIFIPHLIFQDTLTPEILMGVLAVFMSNCVRTWAKFLWGSAAVYLRHIWIKGVYFARNEQLEYIQMRLPQFCNYLRMGAFSATFHICVLSVDRKHCFWCSHRFLCLFFWCKRRGIFLWI